MATPTSIETAIRRASSADDAALAVVGQATFLETFAGVLDGAAIVAHCREAHSAAGYRQWLEQPGCAAWLAEAPGGAPVGYALVVAPDLPSADPGRDLELKRIYLLGRCRGGGTGRRLLAEAIAFARDAGASRLLLGVYAGNAAAIGFYRRHGFVDVAERRFNVGGTAYDDRVMGLALDGSAAHASPAPSGRPA